MSPLISTDLETVDALCGAADDDEVRFERAEPPDSMVQRISAILSAFTANEPELGTNEIARRARLPRSSTSRIAKELAEEGLLERSRGRYVLGIRMFELGELVVRPKDLRRLALAAMADLRQVTGKTVHLAVLEGGEVVYVAILRARDGPPLPSRIGGRMPAFATGVGKALLAFSSNDVIDATIAGGLFEVGPRTITDPGALRKELDVIREAGIAYEVEESGAKLSCVAVPILGPDGQPLAAMSISDWIGGINFNEVGPAVQASVLGLSRYLGTNARWAREL